MHVHPALVLALTLSVGMGLGASIPALAQDDETPDVKAELAPFAGSWTTEWWMQMPGMQAPFEWTTQTTARVMGNWLISDYEGEIMPGMTYSAHDVLGFDEPSGKWVNMYVDSESTYAGRSESIEHDGEGRIMAGKMFDQMTQEWISFHSRVEWVNDDEWKLLFETETDAGTTLFMRATNKRNARGQSPR